MKKTSLLLILALLALGLLRFHDYKHKGFQKSEKVDLTFVPDSLMVSYADLGHHQASAGLIWIQSLVYFGDNMLSGQATTWMLPMMRLVVYLDPDFQKAYQFVGLFVAGADDDIEPILDKGIARFPNDWKMALYYSMQLAERDELEKASKVMKPFEKIKVDDEGKSIPDYISKMSIFFAEFGLPLPLALSQYLGSYVQSAPALRPALEARIVKLVANSWNTRNEKVAIEVNSLLLALINKELTSEVVFSELVRLGNTYRKAKAE
jgi:hypothetical protein